MTGDEIIALARANFGEASPLTVSVQTMKDFVNSALHELYNDLPSYRMHDRLTTSNIVLAGNTRGPVESDWDRIVEVYVNDMPAVQVAKEVIQNSNVNTMFTPPVPIFYVDDSQVWVQGGGNPAKVEIVHMDPPAEIVDFTLEVTAFMELWHHALSFLVTSYMYAQEEDATQATHYRAEYSQALDRLLKDQKEEGVEA